MLYARRLVAMLKTPAEAITNSPPGLNYRIRVGL
jgi:hypothetical protein